MCLSRVGGIIGLLLVSREAVARAQEVQQPVDIEVPVVVLDTGPTTAAGAEADTELDLANIVQSAAKGVTTVQEAPAIVTVITQDEIRDRQLASLNQYIDTVPGWLELGAEHSMFPFPLSRGQLQAGLFLHDGLSLFDPTVNVPTTSRIQPVETIKRIELITGPGGVLWGANSMLGIVNVITKDAEDVDGIEVGVTGGEGNGDRGMMRTYVMAGAPDLLGGRAKAFFHTSFETFIGPGFEMPEHLFSSPVPQPNSPTFYGPLTKSQPARSYLINLDGKLTFGPVKLRVSYPIIDRYSSLGFPGWVAVHDLREDTARDPATGELLCPKEPPFLDDKDRCFDKGRTARDNKVQFYDRYAVAEYQTRVAEGKAGVAVKGYFVHFVRKFEPITILSGTNLLEGGLSFLSPLESYRTGGQFDGDLELPANVRLLYGAEVFHEWQPVTSKRTRQGEGIEATFYAPYDLRQLPLACPRDLDASGNVVPVEGCPLTMTFPASRTILGVYANPQWRAARGLIIDAGARVQVAPSFLGELSYAPTPTFGGTLVYSFLPGWHTKLNVSQGFRPPIFNNLVSNGEAVVIDGDRELEVETSTAGQAEINARIFKGDRRIRELNFRVDYSYTYIQNLIQLVAGRYVNSDDRGIHSVEFLGKLYIQGGHRFELGYTWMKILTEDIGVHRSMPEHWANLGAVFNLVDGTLTATSTLRVIGAMEDPNRIVEHRAYTHDELGHVIDRETGAAGFLSVGPSELVLDRLPPAAELSVGLTYMPTSSLSLQASVLNAFNARYYQPDAFLSYEPRIEYLPNPIEDFRAYLSATYRY